MVSICVKAFCCIDSVYTNRLATSIKLTMIFTRTDLPSIATDRSSTLAESYSRNTANSGLQQTQSLPSFASLQEHVNRPNDIEEREMAFTTSQASCHLCSKLKPRFKEVAIAVAELDDIIQAACTKTVRRVCLLPSMRQSSLIITPPRLTLTLVA